MTDSTPETPLHEHSCPTLHRPDELPDASSEVCLDDRALDNTESSSNPASGPPDPSSPKEVSRKLFKKFQAKINREKGIRSKSDSAKVTNVVWRGFLPFYNTVSSFQLLSAAERKTLLMSLVLRQRDTGVAKRALPADPVKLEAPPGRLGGFLSTLHKKIDGVSQRLNGHFFDLGILRAIDRKDTRAEVLTALKFTMTAEVVLKGDSSGRAAAGVALSGDGHPPHQHRLLRHPFFPDHQRPSHPQPHRQGRPAPVIRLRPRPAALPARPERVRGAPQHVRGVLNRSTVPRYLISRG